MSGSNTKSSKIERILARQVAIDGHLTNIFAVMRQSHETDRATIRMLTETAHRLEAENARLRKYLGSVLFQRRKVESIPTLSEGLCDCLPGVCRGDWKRCRHPSLEPEFGNRAVRP
jgi:hypothetical protein